MAEIMLVSEEYIASHLPDRSTQDIAKLQRRVNDLVADYLRTSFEVSEYTDRLDSKSILVLPNLPIVSVLQMTDLGPSAVTFTENSNYFVYPDHIYIPGRIPGNKDIEVVYQAGLDHVDPLVEVVAEDLVLFWSFKEGKCDELFLRQESMEDRSYVTKAINEESILSRLADHRYKPLRIKSSRGQVRIGVI